MSVHKQELERARITFEDRFYRWANEQAAKEFESDFPLLRRIRSSDVFRAIEILRALPKKEGCHLALIHIRRWHVGAAARAHESLTAEEENLFARYRVS